MTTTAADPNVRTCVECGTDTAEWIGGWDDRPRCFADREKGPRPSRGARKPTPEEAEAILLLVKGGWLKLELTLDH